MDTKYKQNDIVEFDMGTIKGKGMVCGVCQTGQLVIGHTYIIHVLGSDIDPAVYPFSHIACFEVHMKKCHFI